LALIYARSLAPIVGVATDGQQPKPPRTPFEALSKEAQIRLRELMETLDPLGKMLARAQSRGVGPAVIKKLRPVAAGAPKPGDLLSRYYQGRQITVRVLDKGFEYEGQPYRSLSAIAKVITGSHWNGRLFFGLTHQER